MSLRSRHKNLSLGKVGPLPTKCLQWSPIRVVDGKRGHSESSGREHSIDPALTLCSPTLAVSTHCIMSCCASLGLQPLLKAAAVMRLAWIGVQ